MASLGRISNSLVSAVNENTLALASINFDFSIFRIKPPVEYEPVGQALGVVRRKSAETGTAHRTARKLGALFEAIMPSTPKLIIAYGTRSSEIMQTPGVNPMGTTENHGAFASFVGADATSIWAAATSGATAIGIHLLACLLARSFTNPAQATSVWAELVAERQREILSTAPHDSSLNVTQIAALNAANQEISRQDLRQWDASARAWLQTADLAKVKEYTQLRLILENINLPVTGGSNLYTDVIYVWKQAMIGVESLLSGQPQSVTDGGIILAISSWHIFPNLIVLGKHTTNVSFEDLLLPPGCLLTLGITSEKQTPEKVPGIYWSIPLSHYRHYGKPVRAIGEIEDRLTMDELDSVALGSILRHWNVPRNKYDISARWFVSLSRCLSSAPLRPLRWLQILAGASNRLLGSDGLARKNMIRLVDFGYRRGTFLFSPSARGTILPWFGLCCRHILRSFCSRDGTACAVEYLRCIADAGGLGPSQALITHIVPDTQGGAILSKRQHHTYYSAVGTLVSVSPSNIENLDLTDMVPELEEDTDEVSELVKDTGKGKMSSTTFSDLMNKKRREERRERGVRRLGDSRLTYDSLREFYVEKKHSWWSGSFRSPAEHTGRGEPSFLSTGAASFMQSPLRCYTISPPDDDLLCDCDAQLPRGDWFTSKSVQFKKCITDSLGLLRMYITAFDPPPLRDDSSANTNPLGDLVSQTSQIQFEESVRRLRQGLLEPHIDLEDMISIFEGQPNDRSAREFNGINPSLLWHFLEGLDKLDTDSLMKSALDFMHIEKKMVDSDTKPLRDLVFIHDIYESLDGATVSSGIVEFGIHRAKWCHGNDYSQDKSRVFSCVAMMETGTVNIDASNLQEVFALSYGNSIFVSSRLLKDPSIEVPDDALTRMTGNVGRPGLSLLIPPPSGALVRPLSTNYRAVSYEVFDGKRQDNFKGTSLHMYFTSHQFPLDYGTNGIIDHQVFLVETVVSVYDSGKWVGDLNIGRVFQSESNPGCGVQTKTSLGVLRRCQHTKEAVEASLVNFSTVDTWEEVLDTPPSVAVIRAYKNWFTRLAAYTIINQEQLGKGLETEDNETLEEDEGQSPQRKALVVEDNANVCWACVYKQTRKVHKSLVGGSLYIVA
ncbi:hypothetical protein NPX13_g4613 [Xylaria arbuscula]|uniref:Uncharacterized protein n=1 Tax=Xylaria arbuscula TaxID=114810 RepID=A0A9W8NFI3_9PEZI|nr:hypothetical protein NPX13_g4613 [Xylaria arbuscula]